MKMTLLYLICTRSPRDNENAEVTYHPQILGYFRAGLYLTIAMGMPPSIPCGDTLTFSIITSKGISLCRFKAHYVYVAWHLLDFMIRL